MHARLFRSIKKLPSFLPKATLLSLVFLVVLFSHSTKVLADPNSDYAPYTYNFTPDSGLSSGTVQSAGVNNNGIGLVFTVSLHVKASSVKNDTINDHWNRVSQDNSYPSQFSSFLIKVCDNTSPTKCWLNTLPFYTDNYTQKNGDHLLFEKNPKGDYIKDEDVNFSTFADGSAGYMYKYDPTTNSSNQLTSLSLMKGSTVTASLWYCASDPGSGAVKDFLSVNPKTTNPTTFDSLCGGDSYFKIGKDLPITIPADASTLAQQTAASQQTLATQSKSTADSDNLPSCSLTGGTWSTGSLMGCFAQVMFYVIFKPIQWIASLLGDLFDFFLGYSLDSASYGYGFAVTGWKLVRDVSNIFFIIIMVWTGFSAVFGFGKTSMKTVIPNLIINALVINFSLFITRAAIDLSNITARVFYSQMIVCDGTCEYQGGTSTPSNIKYAPIGTGKYAPLSEKIVSAFSPQKMFSPDILSPTAVTIPGQTTPAGGYSTDTNEYASYYIIVTLISAIIMVFIGVMFFKVTFLFLGRVVGLYMCMIFSPFAFLSRGNMPLVGGVKALSWDKWVEDLTSYAMLAPIFVFFLYIIYSFLNSDFAKQIGIKDPASGPAHSAMATLLGIIVPMLIIFFLVKAAQDAAEKSAGTIGKAIQAYGEKATGLVAGAALGVATGGAAYAGTRFGSRISEKIGESRVGQWAASNADNSTFARWTNQALNKGQTGSWDLRQAGVKINGKEYTAGQGITSGLGAFGVKNNPAISNFVGLGEKNFEGGRAGQQKRRQGEIKENIQNRVGDYSHLSDDQAKTTWEKHQNKKAAEKALQKHAEENSPEYAAAATALKTQQDALKAAQKEIANTKKQLKVERDTMTDADKEAAKGKIKAAESLESSIKKNIAESKDKQSMAMQSITKGDEYKKDAGYQAKLKDAVDKQKIEDDKKYGEVKNAKSLAEAMRRDYAEDLRNKSFWMANDEQRPGLWGVGGGYGGLVGALAGVTASATLGSIAAERIKFEQEALDAATSSFIKDFEKGHGKETKLSQLNKKIKDFDQSIDDSVKEALKNAKRAESEIDKMDMDTKKEEFKKHLSKMEDDFEETKIAYTKASDAYKKNKNPSEDDKEAFKETARAKREAEDRLNKAKNLWENREKAQDELQKETDKAKEAAAKK